MIMTEPFLSIVWDEGYTLGREERVRTWFRALRDPKAFAERWQPPIAELVPPNHIPVPERSQTNTRAGLLSPAVLAWFWPFAREEPDGHPPVYALIGLAGDFLAPAWETLPHARLVHMLIYIITCGAIFSFFRTRRGTTPYVLQNRPGALRQLERDLIAHGHPAAVFRKWGVTLLWVFPYRDVDAWEKRKLTPPSSVG
jgi:hypothetical protein